MVVSCNGEERFRFPGEEVFNGFWVIDGQLYTLGQRPGGGGLCFRVNGQERFSSESGVLLNGPDEVEWDGGNLYFNQWNSEIQIEYLEQ